MIDLDLRGTRSGDTTRFSGSTSASGAAAFLPSSCNVPNGHQVALRYTPQRTGRLLVTTSFPTTNFDTVVWVQGACTPGGSMDFGCNDDGGEAPNIYASTMITTAPVREATPVFIVVAGFDRFSPAHGSFTLQVTELTADGADGGRCQPVSSMCDGNLGCYLGVCQSDAPEGESCERQRPCVTGTSCQPVVTGQRCVRDGAVGGNCRFGAMSQCDPGLVCHLEGRIGPYRCARVAMEGEACDPQPCVEGTWCSWYRTPRVCVAPGSHGGLCRADYGCDPGLVCNDGVVCARVVPAGEACDPSNGSQRCAMGSTCGGDAVPRRCVLDGALAGRCRDPDAGSPCDATLRCVEGSCVR